MAAFQRKAIDGFVSGPPFIQQAVVDGHRRAGLSDSAKGEPNEYSPRIGGAAADARRFLRRPSLDLREDGAWHRRGDEIILHDIRRTSIAVDEGAFRHL